MHTDPTRDFLRARRAYEWGRARTSLRRASYVVVPVGIIACLVTGLSALAWLPITLLAWVFAHWRGGAVLGGAFFGLAGGAVTYALPLTVLRPCCSPQAMAAGESCCTMPSACLGAGAVLGFALAAFVPVGPACWRTASGIAFGVGSVAILRCSTLFTAEAVGLVGGLVAGVISATAAGIVVRGRAVR